MSSDASPNQPPAVQFYRGALVKFVSMFLGLGLSVLVGCATTTPAELRSTDGKNFQTTIEAPVATAYRQMVLGVRKCFVHGIFRIDADYFPDTQQGVLTVTAAADPANAIAMVTAKLSTLESGKTFLDAHYFRVRFGSEDSYRWTAQSLADWAAGKPGVCKL